MNHPAPLDLDACAAEPIRIPGGIQPHGALLITEPGDGRLLHVSANLSDFLGVEAAPGDCLDEVAPLRALPPELFRVDAERPAFAQTVEITGRPVHVSAHAGSQGVIVEFEPVAGADVQTLEALYPRLRGFIEQIAAAGSVRDIAQAAVREIRALTGFNRILLYAFDEKGDGTVLAEDGDGVLPSYLDLRFPASDIPPQARELYKLSRIRLIPTADYAPAPLVPAVSPRDGKPVDLGRAALRSVSPIHLEYMRNMDTASSMSISLMVEGELWGLISGHSRAPHYVSPQVRSTCDHLGRVLSLQIEAREQARRTSASLGLTNIQAELLTRIAGADDFASALAANTEPWAAIGGGEGAALISGDQVVVAGVAPDADAVRAIARRLFDTRKGELVTESMAELWPEASAFADVASGLLAVSISQIHPNYLMWFRPEAVRTVNWAGEPQKGLEVGERLHPRKSFSLWKEQVRLRSLAWSAEEVESARRFQGAIQSFVLRRAEERAELTTRLAKINEELESFSYSISHDLRAPFRHVVGYSELLADRTGDQLDETSRRYLANIKEAGLSAGRLVDDLLNFSQLGRNSLRPTRVDMNRLAAEVRRSLHTGFAAQEVEWTIGPLPDAWGDAAMIRQVLQNLFDNALKYSAGSNPPQIAVTGEEDGECARYTVADNGVGFDMVYVHKLFSVFQRLHRADEFPGDGIGLALVRRIVERHGGQVSAQGATGEGARFTFTLPKRPGPRPDGDDTRG